MKILVNTTILILGLLILTLFTPSVARAASQDLIMTQPEYQRPVATRTAVPVKPHTLIPAVVQVYVQWNNAKASVYGGSDGLWWHHTACGFVYKPTLIGVANRTLKCGTLVTFTYHGYKITAPVVDRGPYCCGRSFDFTTQAAKNLHFPDVGSVSWKIGKW